MAYLFIVLGLILVIFTFKYAWRQALGREMAQGQQKAVKEIRDRLDILEREQAALNNRLSDSTPQEYGKSSQEQLSVLSEILLNFERKLDNLGEQEVKSKTFENGDFSSHFKDAEKRNLFNDIKRAYASGKSITEIAQEFEKGKGEIELILNLQK
ncbi:MAG: hypothetical protein GX318_01810 [Clostridia bacterium]|nr:hypothetical protein [Clostridia bacterium]